MADELNEVQPGDRITANLINTLIRRVKNPGGGTGTVAVPNVFGLNLGVARNSLSGAGLALGTVLDTSGDNLDVSNPANSLRLVINQVPPAGSFLSSGQPVSLTVTEQSAATAGTPVPDLFGVTLSNAKQQLLTAQLTLSAAYDPYGTQVDVEDTSLQSRRVLGQVPDAGARVLGGAPVRLLISAEAQEAVPETQVKLLSINPSTAPIRSEIQLIGANFAPSPLDNIVRFNGIRAATPSPMSTESCLFVVIPDLDLTQTGQLPGLTLGATDESDLSVTITTPKGHTGGMMRVTPPLARHLPVITQVTLVTGGPPAGGVFTVGDTIAVGLELGPEWGGGTTSDRRLYFDGFPNGGAPPTYYYTNQFVIPNDLPGIVAGGPAKTVNIRQWLDGYLSPAFTIKIKRNP